MSKSQLELCEVVIPTDRWSVRAISPLDITQGVGDYPDRHPVIIHPGWGKDPERHLNLLMELAEAGYLPVGVDTRYGYCDRRAGQYPEATTSSLLTRGGRYLRTSTSNPYFEVNDRSQNRWEYRRPTVALYICDYLGIGERSYVGHSEGGRIVAVSALASAAQTREVIIVNGAGTGDSSNGYTRLLRSNTFSHHKIGPLCSNWTSFPFSW